MLAAAVLNLGICLTLASLHAATGVPHSAQHKPSNSVVTIEAIQNLYKDILGREADEAGTAHYRLESKTNNVGIAQIADELLQSEEFRDKHAARGILAMEFQQAMVWTSKMKNYLATQSDVDFLYMKLLGREAETSSKQAFDELINKRNPPLTVAELTRDILSSKEYWIVNMYWKLLGRAPDTEGRRHFANLMAEGSTQQWDLTAAQIADELLRSDEFAIRHELDPRAADPSSLHKLHEVQILMWCDSLEHFVLTDRDIVYLYIKILGRFPDEEATRHYKNVVENQDFTIVEMASELLRSDEFQAQGPLALRRDDYLAGLIENMSGDDSAPTWAIISECQPPPVPEETEVEAVMTSALFTVGDHPSVAGNENPTSVDHSAVRSKLGKHQGV